MKVKTLERGITTIIASILGLHLVFKDLALVELMVVANFVFILFLTSRVIWVQEKIEEVSLNG